MDPNRILCNHVDDVPWKLCQCLVYKMDHETTRLLVEAIKRKAGKIPQSEVSEPNRLAMEHNRQRNLSLYQKETLDDSSSDGGGSINDGSDEVPGRVGVEINPEILSEIDRLCRVEKQADE